MSIVQRARYLYRVECDGCGTYRPNAALADISVPRDWVAKEGRHFCDRCKETLAVPVDVALSNAQLTAIMAQKFDAQTVTTAEEVTAAVNSFISAQARASSGTSVLRVRMADDSAKAIIKRGARVSAIGRQFGDLPHDVYEALLGAAGFKTVSAGNLKFVMKHSCPEGAKDQVDFIIGGNSSNLHIITTNFNVEAFSCDLMWSFIQSLLPRAAAEAYHEDVARNLMVSLNKKFDPAPVPSKQEEAISDDELKDLGERAKHVFKL